MANAIAAANLRIAQVKFKQALSQDVRDVPQIPSKAAAQFWGHLDAVLAQATDQNIQTCKEWIIENIVSSDARISLLGDYLISLSRACVVDTVYPGKHLRNRLDILLVINDVLHTLKYHAREQTSATDRFAPYIEELCALAGECLRFKGTQQERTLKALIKYWHVNALLNASDINLIISATTKAIRVAQGDAVAEPVKTVYTLPGRFGEQGAPWHNIPAGYLVEHATRKPGEAVSAGDLEPTRLASRHPTESVCELLDEYFAAVDLMETPVTYQIVNDFNEIGDLSPDMRLDTMGKLVPGANWSGKHTAQTGYGWSVAFADEVRENQIPEKVSEAQEKYRAMRMDVDDSENEGGRRSYRYGHSSSPRRRRFSSDSSGRHKYRGRKERRSSSRSSYRSHGDRSSSGESRDRYRERQSSSRFNDTDPAPGRLPPEPMDTDRYLQNDYPQTRRNPPLPNSNYSQSRAPPPQMPNATGMPFPPQPPFTPQFPMPHFQPPFPGPYGNPMMGVPPPPPPPPPNFNGQFAQGFSPMGQFQNQAFDNFNHNMVPGNAGYGGFNRGGFQGGNSGGRGNYRGNNQRGRGGGDPRWG